MNDLNDDLARDVPPTRRRRSMRRRPHPRSWSPAPGAASGSRSASASRPLSSWSSCRSPVSARSAHPMGRSPETSDRRRRRPSAGSRSRTRSDGSRRTPWRIGIEPNDAPRTLPTLVLTLTRDDPHTQGVLGCPMMADVPPGQLLMTVQETPLALSGEASAAWPVPLRTWAGFGGDARLLPGMERHACFVDSGGAIVRSSARVLARRDRRGSSCIAGRVRFHVVRARQRRGGRKHDARDRNHTPMERRGH